MQSATQPRRSRGVAFSTGLIFALLAAIVMFAYGFLYNFPTRPAQSTLWGIAWLGALFATPFLAGFVGTLRSGRIGSGTMAGFWNGLFVGLLAAVYILVVYYLTISHPGGSANLDQVIQQMNQQMTQRGLPATVTRDAILTGLIVADVIVLILLLISGVVLGLIGALIGKIFAPNPRY